jgi:O-antigen ligase/tetratricopeptide (TPR) repeat protein
MKSEIYVKIIRWGVYLCLLLPLFISRQFFFPYVFPRTAIFRVIIEILFVLWLILVLKDRRYLPKRNALFWSLAALAAIFILTTLTSVDPAKSFLGTMERGSGIFTWLHYFAFFIILTGVFKHKKDWTNFFRLAIGASFLVSLYALAQRLGLQTVYESGVDRATGTIGNAAFLASYLILAAGLTLILLFDKKNYASDGWGWRIFYYAALFLNLAVIYLTETRGAVLGILAGFFAFVLLYALLAPTRPEDIEAKEPINFKRVKKVKKYLIFVLVIVVVFAGSLWLLRNSVLVKKVPGLSRLASISLNEGTAQTRIIAWQEAWQGWKEKFLLGWGPENFNIVFNKYFNPRFLKYSRDESWFDRAHNVVFDIGTTSGLIGLAAYLAVFITALWALWKTRKRNFLLSIFLAALLFAYFVQNLLVFDVFNSLLLFFLLLGFIYFFVSENPSLDLQRNNPEKNNSANNKRKPQSIGQGKIGKGKVFSLIVLVLFLFLICWQYNFRALAADYWAVPAYKEFQLPETKAALADQAKADSAFDKVTGLYKKTLSYQTYGDPEIRSDFGGFVYDNTENKKISPQAREKGFAFALEQIKNSVSEHPLDARWYLLEAKLLEGYAQLKSETNQSNADLVKESEQAINQGISLSPKRIPLQFVLIQTMLLEDRYQEAANKAEETVALYPDFSDSYWYLSLSYIGIKDETSAAKAIDQALNHGYTFKNIDDLKLAASLCMEMNDLPALEKIYINALEFEPQNLQWYASLATVYSKLGQKDKAIETANKIIEIEPDARSQVEEFLKTL